MGYASQLSEDKKLALQPVLTQLTDLPAGGSFLLTEEPPVLDRVRQDIYTFLYSEGLKAEFRLRRLAPTQLFVQRLVLAKPKISDLVSPIKDLVVDELLDLSEDECKEALSTLQQAGRLTELQVEEAFREWRRVCA